MGWLRREMLLPATLFAAIPIGFLIGIALFQLTVAMPEARRSRAETIASFQTLRAVSAVEDAVQDAERGQRGYLITGRDSYLQPYLQAKSEIGQLVSQLQQDVRSDASEEDRLLALQAHLTTKMNELASTIATYRERGFEAAKNIVDTDLGRESMEAIDADLKAIADAEAGRLARRSAEAGRADWLVTATFLIGGLVCVLALVAGAGLLARAYGRAARSEQTLRLTLDSVREGVAAFDGSGRLRNWNASFAKLLDLKPASMRRGHVIPIDPETPAPAAHIIRRIRDPDASIGRAGRPALAVYPGVRGAVLEIFHSRAADGYVATVLDVTEQRKAEEALRQTQKLEALGQMTGGVAHDFNNLLTIIIGSLSFLRRAIGGDPKEAQRIDMLEIAAERGARLTKQLLAFARRQPLEPSVVNLGQLMQEILPLVRRAVGEETVVESIVAGGLWNATIDPAQFQSAVLNLALNSRHAMPEGGKLTIESANAALDDVYAARHADVQPGQYVLFAITDTGAGMDAATLARAMDPFFTTKPVGEGTGLGLPQVYGFVKQSGGHIKLYSEVGEGTTVKLYLPRTLREAPKEAPPPTALLLAGTETILLVDDDDTVRTTVCSMLEELGYSVLAASSGAQALDMLEKGALPDLLLTDVVMPGMGGRQLAERARALTPSLRVLFSSGYTENAIVHNGRLDHGVELLSKPFDRDRLAAKVRRALSGSADAGVLDMGKAKP
jgi:signal transduction histidine kinase/CHASE3 domain sensor protein/ActR/RegA family two-component response regulator